MKTQHNVNITLSFQLHGGAQQARATLVSIDKAVHDAEMTAFSLRRQSAEGSDIKRSDIELYDSLAANLYRLAYALRKQLEG